MERIYVKVYARKHRFAREKVVLQVPIMVVRRGNTWWLKSKPWDKVLVGPMIITRAMYTPPKDIRALGIRHETVIPGMTFPQKLWKYDNFTIELRKDQRVLCVH